jgi:UDP-N-acetylglucosamine transferase subunit ALG13
MIYVTVGTDSHDFSRLVRAMDTAAFGEKVVMQIGNTEYEPKNAEWFRFEKNRVMESFYRKADVIVTHAGAGSIIRSLTNGKIPVVVPRLKEHGEHVNNHQLDIARALGKKGVVVLVEDLALLRKAIKTRKKARTKPGNTLVRAVKNYLEEYEKKIS